ncbi:MAG: DNA repair protein RadC [Bacilli bacterium]|nr:DNA repair protein RadC [Bacilli bacterium]
MLFTINDLPKDDRPRERLLKNGPTSLSDYELLAIILRTGNKKLSCLDLAKKVISQFKNIGAFNEITISELKEIEGIKDAKAIEILASIEFGKRVCNYYERRVCLKDRTLAYKYIRYDLENLKHEEFRVYYLDVRGGLVECKTLSIGCVSSATCDLREVVKWALKLSSYHIIVSHNHPTGDPSPSDEDINFTRNLIIYCENMGIKIVDHLIIGKNSYYSFDQDYIFRD